MYKPLLHIFNQPLQSGIFPEKLKIARVTLLFKKGNNSELGSDKVDQIDQVNTRFERNQFTSGIFTKFSKVFDTVDHKILISKLKNYSVRRDKLKWFESYLNNCIQFIVCNNKYTSFEMITCGVPQGSIPGPFLIYVNDLNQRSNILDPTKFSDDTNFFSSHHQIKTFFEKVNCELKSQWFRANKLLLNVKKQSIHYFKHFLSKTKFL